MEREPRSPEQNNFSSPELERRPERPASPERAETKIEREHKAEAAREVIEHQAESTPAEHDHAPKPAGAPTRLDLDRAYRETLQSLQRHLKPASRAFSRVIHNPTVEQASEVVGQTVARPSVTLGATSTALIVGLASYITAKRYGFTLSGSELILSLIVGGIIGVVLEFIIKSLRRPRS